MDYIKHYPCGLTLIVSEGGAISCSFAIMIGTGSINETLKNNGISHYIEHMSFKGTKEFSSFEISNQMELAGANFNAYTSTDTTCFYAQVIKEKLEKTFYVLSQAVFVSVYPNKEAQKEKGVIIEEINMSEDTPDEVCFDLAARSFFGDDGYGRTILGTAENVASFTQTDVKNYINDYYVAENTVVTFAGNVSFSEAQALVEKCILPLIKGGKTAKTPEHNIINKKQRLSREKDIEQVHFCLTFPSVNYTSIDKSKSEMAVCALGGGMSSRLFMKVREELGLAYSVYSFANRLKDVGTVSIYAGVNTEKSSLAFEAICDTISALKKDGIREDEFEKIKNQIKSSTVFALERPTSKVQLFSKYYLMTKKLYDEKERIAEIDRVKKSDVEDATQSFDFDNMATAVVGRKVKPI